MSKCPQVSCQQPYAVVIYITQLMQSLGFLDSQKDILSFECRSKEPGILGAFRFKQRAENAGIEWFIFGYFVNDIHDGRQGNPFIRKEATTGQGLTNLETPISLGNHTLNRHSRACSNSNNKFIICFMNLPLEFILCNTTS